ncbi:hypothetical protein [Algoriphagus halophilus]|uniref:Outer membrane protein beta-barrel domain-containing protein n=1 Tax=Algoriphagus halophilus TaxID=226505 RepID=A0A1N6DZP8_9BACT|nr:hypothetical protein [Algoriphagus halophilus]SIN76250.1 hypothetical protein SAMN05444394_1568 [Algoriphagus halophilus]
MKFHYFMILFYLCFFDATIEATAQTEEPQPEFYKNSLQGSLGFAGLFAAATSNYERIISLPQGKWITATYLRFGIGAYGVWGGKGNFTYLQYGVFTGKKANHFEISAGPNIGFKEVDSEIPVISFSTGYRLQKPGKHFMLRTGVGLPESIYFGLGWSF